MRWIGVVGLIGCVGCVGSERVVPISAPADVARVVEDSSAALVLPSSVQCVSGPSDDAVPTVVRVSGFGLDGSQATLSISRGPQFMSRIDGWAELDDVHDVTLKRNGDASFVSSEVGIAFEGSNNLVFRGAVDVGRGPESLLCWDPQGVFGSPWGQEPRPGLFDAHYDWSTGDCKDAEGRSRLNSVPVEMVRELGWGECVDLSGEILNGADFGAPQLQGWFLAGARLDGAQLFFADLRGATLAGTAIDQMEFGYAVVEGFTDTFTTTPESCNTVESPWGGPQVSCSQ